MHKIHKIILLEFRVERFSTENVFILNSSQIKKTHAPVSVSADVGTKAMHPFPGHLFMPLIARISVSHHFQEF